jgi:hypothetical protein
MEPVKKFGQDILWRGKIFHNDIIYFQQQARLLNGEQVQVVSWFSILGMGLTRGPATRHLDVYFLMWTGKKTPVFCIFVFSN